MRAVKIVLGGGPAGLKVEMSTGIHMLPKATQQTSGR